MEVQKSSDSQASAGEPENVARQRMLAARDRVRRYFSLDAIAGTDAEVAEVVGQRDVIAEGKAPGGG